MTTCRCVHAVHAKEIVIAHLFKEFSATRATSYSDGRMMVQLTKGLPGRCMN